MAEVRQGFDRGGACRGPSAKKDATQKRWRPLKGAKFLADVISGVVFEDGVKKEAA